VTGVEGVDGRVERVVCVVLALEERSVGRVVVEAQEVVECSV
jgi:hypothetical protein